MAFPYLNGTDIFLPITKNPWGVSVPIGGPMMLAGGGIPVGSTGLIPAFGQQQSVQKLCAICQKIGHWSNQCPRKQCTQVMVVHAHVAKKTCDKCGGKHKIHECPVPYKYCIKCACLGNHKTKHCPKLGQAQSSSGSKCGFCDGANHKTEHHLCETCGRTGAHRMRDCPY